MKCGTPGRPHQENDRSGISKFEENCSAVSSLRFQVAVSEYFHVYQALASVYLKLVLSF